ncbi:tyrosine-type recombinase/integrase [Gelidibacter japonicus]|uniref:tyrosine-type recombinase/integrase n=1 Tax=Gelidibacter japonicus TaxID=1962232 RepID=UPI003A8E100C
MPKQKLTDPFIRGFSYPGKEFEFYDTVRPGFIFRISKNGHKSFSFRYKFGEKLQRFTIGTYPTLSLSKARSIADDLYIKVKQGIDPQNIKMYDRVVEEITFKELVDDYKENHLLTLKDSTRIDYENRLKHLIKGEGNSKLTIKRGLDGKTPIKMLKRYDLIVLLNDIAKTSPTQAKRIQAILSGIFKHAKNREWIETNIASSIPIKAKKRSTEKGLKWTNVEFNDSQIQSLWTALNNHPDPVSSFFKVLLFLGQRSGETRLMKWDNISFKEQIWKIPSSDTKNGLQHIVPLPKHVIKILKELNKDSKSDFVFESPTNKNNPIGSQQKAAQRIRENYNIEGFNIHSLRTTVATRLAGQGTPPQVLSKILNHKKPAEGSLITAVYNKYNYTLEMRTALEKWANQLERIISEEEHNNILSKIG